MTDAPTAQPKRQGYLGLILPFGLFAVALAAWSVWWFTAAHRVEAATDLQAAQLKRAGWQVNWSSRQVSGWPFRTFVGFDQFRAVGPNGQGIETPRLEAEAETYDIGRWIIAAPRGLTLLRGDKGAVRITGQAIRASITHLNQNPPQVAVELRSPTFTPLEGSAPYPLLSADIVDFYLRKKAGSADDGEFLFRVLAGRVPDGSALSQIAGSKPFTGEIEGGLTRLDRLKGRDWPSAVKTWTRSGGSITALQAEIQTGSFQAKGGSQGLSIGPDGRLRGDLSLKVGGWSSSPIAIDRLDLVFTPDAARLGPIKLGPAPKVF